MVDLDAIKAELARRLEANPRSNSYLTLLPKVKCADGFELSVQASEFHYCAPRNSVGPWREVEVGFPTARVESFMPFIDGGPSEDPTDTVYGYVPIDLVAQAIADHGGFAA